MQPIYLKGVTYKETVLELHIWKICLIPKTTAILQSVLVMALQIEKMVEVR